MKLLKKLLLITLGIMFCLFLFELKPTSVYASESQDFSIDEDYQLDDDDWIHIHVDATVDYDWDEDYYGWINNLEVDPSGGVGSDTVYIDELYLYDDEDPGASTLTKTYFFLGHDYLDDFRGYITVRASCDEYGNVELELYYDPA